MKDFLDRRDAGQQLAKLLVNYHAKPDTLILALPRGGVPIAAELAKALDLPLDIFLVRKLGVPYQQELAMGAIAQGGVCILNHGLIKMLSITDAQIQQVKQQEQQELDRRLQAYRRGKPLPNLQDKTIILVDDGVATGATFKAAIQALKRLNPKKLVIAVPVVAQDTWQELQGLADEAYCVLAPDDLRGISLWYQSFEQVSDQEVIKILDLLES